MRGRPPRVHAGDMDKAKLARGAGVASLVVLGLVAVLVGLLDTWVSSCCGSPDPSDPLPASVGVALGLGFFGLAGLLHSRR